MASGNVIDQLWVALGFKADDAGLKQFKAQAQSVRDGVLELGAAIAGVAATGMALKAAVNISDTFEKNSTAIGLFLSQFGQASDFAEGLSKAEGVLNKITNDAAKLPGTAEDYIEVFRAGLPAIANAFQGQTPEAIADFTNMFAALGNVLQVDAPQIGRDMALMLGPVGRAGGHVKTFASMLGSLRRLPGMENLNAEKFNAMSQEARIALIRQVTESKQVKDAMAHSADGYDAMIGALSSGIKQLTRLGTAGLFKGIKDALADINALFFQADGKLTATGENVVELLTFVGRILSRILRDGVDMVVWFARLTKESKAFKLVLFGIGAFFAASNMMTVIGLLAKLAAGFKLAALTAGFMWIALGLLIEDVYGFLTGADSVTGELVEEWAPALDLIIGLIIALAGAIAAPLGVLMALIALGVSLYAQWDNIITFIEGGINGWIKLLNAVIEKINVVMGALGFSGIDKIGERSYDEFRRAPTTPQALRTFNGGAFTKMQDITGDAVPSWLGRPAGGSGGGTSVQSTTHVGTVNIMGNDDPKKVHEGWNRDVRDGQTKVGL